MGLVSVGVAHGGENDARWFPLRGPQYGLIEFIVVNLGLDIFRGMVGWCHNLLDLRERILVNSWRV